MSQTAFILIVEVESDDGKTIADGLRHAGHACHVVHDGQDAITSIKKRPPDVVITDHRLGGDISHFVAPKVEKRIVERLARGRAAPGKGD